MATWDRYKQTVTGLELKSYLGDVFTIRSYCDDPLGGVFVAKEPVCKLLISPRSVFINTDFNWDIFDSVSSTGTIDTFDIDYDGPTSGGDISGGDWSVDPLSGTNQYTSKGHFTIVASVTDTLGNKSKEVRIPIIAIDGTDEDAADIEQSLQRVYIGTTDSGCWVMTPTSAPAASNTGLSGDDLKFRDMRINPTTIDDGNDKHHLWAATKNGVAYTFDGAANWLTVSKATLGDPVNTAGDGTPPVTADLDQIGISLDPRLSQRVYCLRTKSNRSWLYYSDDYGVTWSNVQISDGGGNAFDFEFDSDTEGWVIQSGEQGSVAWVAGDGNDAVGCIEGTTSLLSGNIYHCDLEKTLTTPVVGIPTFEVAIKSAAAISIYPKWVTADDVEVATTPVLAAAGGAWASTTFVSNSSGVFPKLRIHCVETVAGAPTTIRLDDIRLITSFNFTHSAGGIPGSILV